MCIMEQLSDDKQLNEDIIACKNFDLQKLKSKVPSQTVNGFLKAHKVLQELNLQILSVGPLMEENVYLNYEDSRGNAG